MPVALQTEPETLQDLLASNIMVPIASLLNPSSSSSEGNEIPQPASRTPSPLSLSLPASKKQKMSKGASIVPRGKPNGEIKYPPFEAPDGITMAEYQKFEVKSVGQISEFPKRIPYNSDKKSFQQKTGRAGFEGKMDFSKEVVRFQDAYIPSIPVYIQDTWRR